MMVSSVCILGGRGEKNGGVFWQSSRSTEFLVAPQINNSHARARLYPDKHMHIATHSSKCVGTCKNMLQAHLISFLNDDSEKLGYFCIKWCRNLETSLIYSLTEPSYRISAKLKPVLFPLGSTLHVPSKWTNGESFRSFEAHLQHVQQHLTAHPPSLPWLIHKGGRNNRSSIPSY